MQEELDELLVKVAAERSVYEQTMGNLKAAEEASAALKKKCSDAEALLEKKTLQVGAAADAAGCEAFTATPQVEAAKKSAKSAPAKKK